MRLRPIAALLIAAVPACVGLAMVALPEAWRLIVSVTVAYAACLFFTIGIVARVLRWAKAPVPFRIPTTSGQQQSLAWIRPARLDNPATGAATAGRMALEVLCFRSLSRNTSAQITRDRISYRDSLALWLAALLFHWSFLLILIRHLRLVTEPVPAFVLWLMRVDAFFQIGSAQMFLSDIAFLAGLLYLCWRRLTSSEVRYISLVSDYLALWLLLGIGTTGVMMACWLRVDITAIKQFALGLVTFAPVLPHGISPLFFAHLFLVSALAVYIPSGKLMHMAGVWLSPTRNMANNNRARHHVNPWNAPVKTHTYAEWQEENLKALQMAGIPLEEADAERTHSN